MHRFYSSDLKLDSTHIDISNVAEIHHMTDVLRLKKGQQVEIINGEGLLATGTIKDIKNICVSITIDRIQQQEKRLPHLILACAIPKKGKFENIIEKTTELGVDEIIPLQTQNSDVILKGDKKERKKERYAQVAINAAKQCQRATLPLVHAPTDFKDALSTLLERGTVVIPSLTDKTQPILEALQSVSKESTLSILIGPEGDFSKDEYETAHSNGCLAVSLGPTVLKVETAAITSVAMTRFVSDAKNG